MTLRLARDDASFLPRLGAPREAISVVVPAVVPGDPVVLLAELLIVVYEIFSGGPRQPGYAHGSANSLSARFEIEEGLFLVVFKMFPFLARPDLPRAHGLRELEKACPDHLIDRPGVGVEAPVRLGVYHYVVVSNMSLSLEAIPEGAGHL